MVSLDEVARSAGVSVERRGGLCLIKASDALDFVAEAKAAGISILGVEGFWVRSGEVVPDMGATADFSSTDSAEESIRETLAFLANFAERDDFWFDFVIDAAETT